MKASIIFGLIIFACSMQAGTGRVTAAESELVIIVTPYLTTPVTRNGRTTIRRFGVKKRTVQRIRSDLTRKHRQRRRLRR